MGFIKDFKNIKSSYKEIRTAALEMPDSISGKITQEQWHEQFKNIWKVVKPTATLAKAVTPNKVDKIIDELVVIGNEIATQGLQPNSKSVFIEKFTPVWSYLRVGFFIAMTFTDDKVDKILESIVAWGDLLSEQHVA